MCRCSGGFLGGGGGLGQEPHASGRRSLAGLTELGAGGRCLLCPGLALAPRVLSEGDWEEEHWALGRLRASCGGHPRRPLPNSYMEGTGGRGSEASYEVTDFGEAKRAHDKGGTHDTPQKKLTGVGGQVGAEACRLPRPCRLKTDLTAPPPTRPCPVPSCYPPPSPVPYAGVHHRAQGWGT